MAATLAASLGPFELAVAAGGRQAAEMLRARSYHLVLVDLASLADFGASTEDAVARLVKLAECALLIAVADGASVSAAVAAMRAGAHDYVARPISGPALAARIGDLAQRHGKTRQWLLAVNSTSARDDFAGLVGFSSQMQFVYQQIARIALSPAPVFITGESGTGKELCAEAIHRKGSRAARPFVPLNCGAIPKELMESEIFGHVKGSFTGAIADREGAAKYAHGGTLFLDEICEMDILLQTKLLRFLQTGVIQRVGSAVAEKVDVRVVCATNRNPLDEIAAGRFREDLYYRLHVLPVKVPPLRERKSDIVLLARHFLVEAAREEGKAFGGLAMTAESALCSHSWPGNVRELQNVIRNAVVMHDGERLEAHMLPELAPAGRTSTDAAARSYSAPARFGAPPDLRRMERDAIETMIASCGGSIPRAAQMLGVSPSTIYRKRETWLAQAGH